MAPPPDVPRKVPKSIESFSAPRPLSSSQGQLLPLTSRAHNILGFVYATCVNSAVFALVIFSLYPSLCAK
uniref:Delta-12 fatty acid desaturase n=1 Tax=Steinernema glaseri TaxID=37863 RepID=A0A1I8A5X8_9BILA